MKATIPVRVALAVSELLEVLTTMPREELRRIWELLAAVFGEHCSDELGSMSAQKVSAVLMMLALVDTVSAIPEDVHAGGASIMSGAEVLASMAPAGKAN